jgi:ribosomal-protein-alanine N-acetyltransferase
MSPSLDDLRRLTADGIGGKITTGHSLMGQPTFPAPPEAISTKGLVLRRPRLPDANDIFDSYAADPEVTRYVTWRPYRNRSEVAPFLQSRLARWDSGEEFSWAITRAEEDRVIGMIGCRVREQAADIGYVMSRKYWNRGYITEAAKAVVDWAGNLEFIYRVWAVCDVENKASARVLEKVGMQREGTLRRYIVHPNVSPEPRDCFVYSKVR